MKTVLSYSPGCLFLSSPGKLVQGHVDQKSEPSSLYSCQSRVCSSVAFMLLYSSYPASSCGGPLGATNLADKPALNKMFDHFLPLFQSFQALSIFSP